nr:hypothetical protein [Tanacetum cinerariifolium]
MDTTIDQQVALDEALIPHARRLRIGRSNFCLLSNISSKESTLQLVYDATTTIHHHSIRFKMDNKKHIINLESFKEMLHICPRLPGQSFVEPPFKEEILAFLRFLRHSGAIRRLTDVEHKDTKKSNEMYYPRNSNAYKEYYAVATGATPLKPKASIRKTRSSFDTTITPPTAVAGLRLSTSAKGKQPATTSKAKSPSSLSKVVMTEAQQLKIATKRSLQQTHISQLSGFGVDEGTGDDNDDDEGDNADDGEEGNDDDDDDEQDDNDQEDKGNDDDDEQDDDDDDDKQDNNDARDDDDQEDKGDDDEDDQEEGSDDEQAFDEEEFIYPSLSTHAKEETRDEESFDPILKTPKNTDVEGNGEEILGTNVGREEGHDEEEEEDELYRDVNINLGRGSVSSIPGIVQRYMDQRMNEAVKVAVQIQSDHLRDEAQKENDEFLKNIDENMQKIIKEQVKEQVKTSYVVIADLFEMELKKILIEKMEGNKSIHRSKEQRNLYKALVKAYESNKIILDTYGDTVTLKRRRDDDADKDEEPSAGSDRGSKRHREGKEPESASTLKEKATRSTKTFEIEETSHPEFETGADDQPIVEPLQHPQWFSQQKKPPNPYREWNKTLPATHGSIQPWISELTKQSDSCSSFNELMDTPGSFKSLVELEFFLEEVYKSTTDQLDWVNPEGTSSRKYTTSITKTKAADYEHIKWIEDLGCKHQQFYGFAINRESARDVYSTRRIITATELRIVEWYNYKHLDWITVRQDDDKLYKFKEGDFKRLRIQDIEDIIVIQRRVEDLQLNVESYQKKLNLTKPDTYRSDLKRKEAYIAYSNPRGFIYQNKDKQNRLMRIVELHKFSDGTLTYVRTALDDRFKGIHMKYLSQTIWRKSNKERAAFMI